ncbi:MAG: DUF3656 domain-containing protein, partial [Planctomycetota bacterium]
LCVAYSGQCLTSESLGGRSANRGQCAQACRLPYELVCDGEDVDLGDVRYLLSPQDLAGYDAIVELMRSRIASLKIEGRLKTPEYVANLTGHYRRMIDQAVAKGVVSVTETAQREMELSFSRGFSPGWLQGNDHKRLVPGKHSAKRGIHIGDMIRRKGNRLLAEVSVPIALGDGLAIESNETSGSEQAMEGGRIYSLERDGSSLKRASPGEHVWIGFGRDEINWDVIETGASVFKNDDPELNRRLRATYRIQDAKVRRPIDFHVIAKVDHRLEMIGTVGSHRVTAQSSGPLEVARKHPPDECVIREKLSRLGATTFELRRVSFAIEGRPMIPSSILNELRRRITDELASRVAAPPPRNVDSAAGLRLLEPIAASDSAAEASTTDVRLSVLCRTLEQADAAAEAGIQCVYVDFHDVREYAEARRRLRNHASKLGIATVRMQKPGEMGLLRVLRRHEPDMVLARNLAAIQFCRTESIPFVADFSLNVANHRAAEWIQSLGADRVTASYDLNRDQMLDLVESIPPAWLEVVLHQHIPMFHMEHCVFCSVLSPGTDKTNCGRPCDRHVVQLRDRVGMEHTLQADVACRNTLYNAKPQSGAEIVPDLLSRSVR